jgi:TATA-box binding protein (TBP) (component of TFIID and TFIIIB)
MEETKAVHDRCSDELRIITITAGFDTGQDLDVLSCYRGAAIHDHPHIAWLQLYCAETGQLLVKKHADSEMTRGVKSGACNAFRNQMTAFIRHASCLMKCRMFRSGKLHIVGARSFQAVEGAVDAMHDLLGLTRAGSARIYMVNVGFRIPHLINRSAACRLWNMHHNQHGCAMLNTERHAALKIRLKTSVCLLVFRTGTVQITGNSMEVAISARNMWRDFLDRHHASVLHQRGAFSDVDMASSTA